MYKKFKRFHTVQLQELAVADPLKSPSKFFTKHCLNFQNATIKIELTTFASKNHEN
jgi:hypothetical protein